MKTTARALACVAALTAIGAAEPAAAQGPWIDRLLAPEGVCRGQENLQRPRAAQVRTMLCMHRYARRALGRGPLYRHGKLRRSAFRKARDLRRCQHFSHYACRRAPFYWFGRTGYARGAWRGAENIAMGSTHLGSVRATMSAWLRSRSHRRVLLSRRYRHVGFGLVRGRYRGSNSVRFWVAHFGRRR